MGYIFKLLLGFGSIPIVFVGANVGDKVGENVGAMVVTPVSEQVAGGGNTGQNGEDKSLPLAHCENIHLATMNVTICI